MKGKLSRVSFTHPIEILHNDMMQSLAQGVFIQEQCVAISLPNDSRFIQLDFGTTGITQLIPIDHVMAIYWESVAEVRQAPRTRA